ncbi:hypothetical protein CsSME_00053379 [Camellia sinensis var. sinensis]
MSQKRQQDDGKARSEATSSDEKRRKLPSLRNVVMEMMSLHRVQRCMEPVLEPLIRRVVKEEVELALRKYVTSIKRNCGKEIRTSESRSLQLQFLPKISLPVFTGTRIEGEDCHTIKVALIDSLTGQVVYSGPESSAKVEIVVLEGDFDGDEGGNCTLEEFKNNIVREREGKKPLLTGDAFLNLKEGIGFVGEISFTDNSSWTRSRKFRLGARVVDNFDGIRVSEAMTESFIVRDHRGELYKKHHPPSLLDEVWRLEKIGKDGAFHKRLSREKVNTVKDFLTLLYLDPMRLRNILGTGMSAKMWELTIDHAGTCTLDSRLYFYCPPQSEPKAGVVFNVVGQVMGLLSECQYTHVDKLSETEKAFSFLFLFLFVLFFFPIYCNFFICFFSLFIQAETNNLVIAAFKQWEHVVCFEDEASLMNASSCLFNNVLYSDSTMVETSGGNKIGGFDYPQASACSPDIIPSIYSMAGVNSLDDFGLHNIDSMDLTYDHDQPFANSLICETESITQVFDDDEHLQYFDADCPLRSQNSDLASQSDLCNAVNGFLLARSAAFAQMRWTKLFSVLKWFSVRRIVAMKKLSQRRTERLLMSRESGSP